MKKKEQKGEGLTLQFLEKKYQQEKQILVKQNKRLSAELIQEIERYNKLASKMQKNQEEASHRCEDLMRQNQHLNARILELEKQQESFSLHEEQEFQILNEQKRLIIQNEALQHEKQELQTIIEKIYQEKVKLEQELHFNANAERELQQEMEILAQKHEKYKRESQRQLEELAELNRNLLQEKEREAQKYSEQKKKKKDLEKKVEELQKIADNIKFQENRLYEEMQTIRNEKDREHEKLVELSTKYALSQAKVSNLENYIAKTEEQLKEADKKLAYEKDQHQDLRNQQEKLIAQYRTLQQQYQKQRQEAKRLEAEIERSTLSKEEIIKAMRRNETQELIGIIKQGKTDLSHHSLHKYSSGGDIHQNNLSQPTRVLADPGDRLVERAKLEIMINNLESDLAQSRKQAECSHYELQRLKRANEDKTLQIQRKQSEMRELRLRAQKYQTDRNRELVTLRNQNQLLRCRQTEKIEQAKELEQYKAAMTLKLAFYERKIKEHLDTIDRKQTIIQKLQLHKNQSEDKQKIYEDHLRKMNDEIEFLKKFKQDCNRKDELVKEYRAKLDKTKQENEDLKSQVAQLKKDKHRIEKQIESKDQYIATLKAKQEKGPQERSQEAQKENKKLSELRNGYEHKLTQLKKEKEVLRIYLNEIRNTIMNKLEECLARQIPTTKKQTHQYEAAKLLGIKPGQIEQFLNPNCVLNKKIAQQLEEDWAQGNYSQFVARFIEYYSTQKQRQRQ